jgi:hypothetical protein
MRTRIVKLVFPSMAIVLAISGAFAGSKSFQNDSDLVDKDGWIEISPTQCEQTTVECSTVFNEFMCKDDLNNDLKDGDGNSCPLPLYRKAQ